MAYQLRFLAQPLPNVPSDELLRRYRHIDEIGFDLAAVADHFVDWNHPPNPWFEAWTLLAAVARETSSVRLATWVTQMPLRNPALLAHQALTTDHLSNGRLELGLGTGITIDPSCEMMGIPNWSRKERVARFREYVEIVDRLLSDEVTNYKGQYYEVNGAVMNPRPVQQPRPPLVIAAMGPIMLKYAAQYADNWNSLSSAREFETQLDQTRSRIRLIDQYCGEIGRDPTSLRRSYLMFDANARLNGGLFGYYESPKIFTDMVRRVIDLGITEIGVYYPLRAEQIRMFEKIAREVIPLLKGEHTAHVGH